MMDNRFKIIVGVDYGTTYTGVSYVTSDKTINNITVISEWKVPGENVGPPVGSFKVPSRIAYASEQPVPKNPKLAASKNLKSGVYWGYGVKAGMKSYSWTKLLLDKSAETEMYDDPSLKHGLGSGMFELPPGTSAQKVCQDYLAEVYKFTVARLEKQMTKEIFDVTPMECYLTMPAIWSDQAQTATREAAKAAGFGSRPFDSIKMIREPEAAALAALKGDLSPGSVHAAQPGENILVLDCGGGTVDITTYTIKKAQPTIVFEELVVGIGGKCGSTYIDREFHKLMMEWFPDHFPQVPLKLKGPGSAFMNMFENAKRDLSDSVDDDDDEAIEIKLHLGEGVESEHYDDEFVLLKRKELKQLFEPVVNQIRALLEDQVTQIKKLGKKIDTIILVGGFGDSDYLYGQLKRWCQANGGIKLINPAFCQAAIVRGAAIRGLEGTGPSKLICRRHYGITMGRPFKNGIDDEKNAYIDMYTGNKYCAGYMNWKIEKGAEINSTTFRTIEAFRSWSPGSSYIFTAGLYSCNLDTAPQRIEHPRIKYIGAIKVDFSKVDMKMFQWKNTPTGIVYKIEYTFKINFLSEQGVLNVVCMSGDKTLGNATIDFDD
ncbi:hypothetical protein F5884DRAFT_246530 [Xylogone sp. PMI_703]|nr:hypothetical protein F5884DRAFT_246530 [Xylogone sp. PMI_703]